MAANSVAFEEEQKLVDQVEQPKRPLEKKTAEDLGEARSAGLETDQGNLTSSRQAASSDIAVSLEPS